MGPHDFLVEGGWQVAISFDDAESRQQIWQQRTAETFQVQTLGGGENGVEPARAQIWLRFRGGSG